MDATILAIITGFVTGIVSLAVAISTKRDAATKQSLDALGATVSQLQAENKRMSERLSIVEGENEALKDWAERLVCQVRGAGLVPEKYIEPKTEPLRR